MKNNHYASHWDVRDGYVGTSGSVRLTIKENYARLEIHNKCDVEMTEHDVNSLRAVFGMFLECERHGALKSYLEAKTAIGQPKAFADLFFVNYDRDSCMRLLPVRPATLASDFEIDAALLPLGAA